MQVRRGLALLDVERAGHAVVGHHLTEGDTAGLLHRPLAHFGFLQRIAVAIDDRARGLLGLLVANDVHALHELEPADAVLLVEEVVRRHGREPEVFPPRHLLFAAVPVEQIREQPARVVRVPGHGRLGPQPLEQTRARRQLPPLEFAHLFRRLRRLHLRPRHLRARGHNLRAQTFEPVAQRLGGAAVVLVVAGHGVARLCRHGLRRVTFERQLEGGEMHARISERNLAHEAVVLLELLDRVALHTRTHRLPHHRQQIHETFAAQQPIELVGPRRKTPHQPLERRGLVGRVVIHVHAGMLGPPRLDEVHHLLEGALLFGVVVRPPAAVFAPHPGAEQVLTPALARVGRTLEVQEDVAGRRLRQPAQPLRRHHRQQLVDGLPHRALLMLHARLIAQPLVGLARAACGRKGQRIWQRRRGFERGRPMRFELAPVRPADAGDERQMVVGPATSIAARPPAAELTGLRGFGVGARQHGLVSLGECRQQLAAHAPEVGGVVVHAVAVDDEEHVIRARARHKRGCGRPRGVARRGDHVEPLGRHALHAGQQLRIRGELQDGAAARLFREFRVVRLVAPGPEVARAFHAHEDVRIAAPVIARQCRLVDHVHAARHRRARSGVRVVERQAGEIRYLQRALRQPREVAAFVFEAAFPQRLPDRIAPFRFGERATGDGEVEPGLVAAGEEGRKIRGREDELVRVCGIHGEASIIGHIQCRPWLVTPK